MWYVVVTMTTVGYGDYVAVTNPGRVIGFIVCILGVIIVSFTVVLVDTSLKFSSNEERSYRLLERLK